MARPLLIVALLATLALPACSSVPGFCGASDHARLAVAAVSPDQYPKVAGQQVNALRNAARGLKGAQGKLARKVVADLVAASKTKANSLHFADAYNRFVSDSNTFDHHFCNETPPPD